MKCPCGQKLQVKTQHSFRFNCEVEVLSCLCGREKQMYEPDPQRGEFIQFTHKLFNHEVAPQCKSNEVSLDKYKAMADSL